MYYFCIYLPPFYQVFKGTQTKQQHKYAHSTSVILAITKLTLSRRKSELPTKLQSLQRVHQSTSFWDTVPFIDTVEQKAHPLNRIDLDWGMTWVLLVDRKEWGGVCSWTSSYRITGAVQFIHLQVVLWILWYMGVKEEILIYQFTLWGILIQWVQPIVFLTALAIPRSNEDVMVLAKVLFKKCRQSVCFW